MAKLLKLRRGTTSQHASFTGAEGEVTIDTTKDTAVVHDGSQAGGRPLAREDMSNVSSASIAGQLGTDSIATTKIAAGALPTDVTVTNANVVSNAAIAGTKISPNFGGQNIQTTGQLQIAGSAPTILLNDENNENDFEVSNTNGVYKVRDIDAGVDRLTINSSGTAAFSGNLDVGSGIDVTGNITVSGTVDGRDVAADGSKLDGIDSGAKDDQTKAEIDALNINADQVDGLHASSFARSDADDTLSGDITFTNSGQYPVVIGSASGMHDGRLLLRGSSNPYVRFREGNTDKAYIQWNAGGYLQFVNEESGEYLRIKSGNNGLTFTADGTERTVWHSGNDGSGTGLDADTVDGKHKTDFMQKGAPGSSNHYNADSWLEFDSNNGLYYPNNSAYHIYLDGSYFLLRNNQNYNGIALNTNASSRRGYVYVDNGNNIGFLNSGANWSLKCDNSGNVTATGNVTAYSDARLKTNVNTINDALSIVGKLRGVSFDWKESGKRSIGVIAQEVEEVLPELVLTQQVLDPTGEKEVKSVDYGKIVGVLINAINELKAEVDKLKGGK